MSGGTVILRAPEIADTEVRLAARYMWRRQDAKIAELLAEEGALDRGALSQALVLRYGPPAAKARVRRRTSIEAAVAEAYAEAGSAATVEGVHGRVFRLEWNEDRALAWFQAELARRWPTGVGMPFLAEDIVTLWVVCDALDHAELRDRRFADDPFPAVPVLITGPTGVGKELIATAMHLASGHRGDLGAINCGSIPEALLESELFGYERGAFTDARREGRPGLVLQHASGTLFLDEVGEMTQRLQTTLLRFLTNGRFRRVGSDTEVQATPRILAATKVDLAAEVTQGRFRDDLYYRLRGHHIRIRGLSERRRSVPSLARRFLAVAAGEGRAPRFTREAERALALWSWPGNMRELRYYAEEWLRGDRVLIGIDDLQDDLVRCYVQEVSGPEREALAVVAAREAGEPDARQRLRAEAALRSAARAVDDPHALRLRKVRDILRHVGESLGLEDQVAPHMSALEAVATRSVAETFRDQWIGPFRAAAEGEGLDLTQVLKGWEKVVRAETKKSMKEQHQLRPRIEQNVGAHALAMVVQLVLPYLQRADDDLLDRLLHSARSLDDPNVKAVARQVGQFLRTLSPGQLVGWLTNGGRSPPVDVPPTAPAGAATPRPQGEDARPDVAADGSDAAADTPPPPTPPSVSSGAPQEDWSSLQRDYEALEGFVRRAGSQVLAAEALGIRRETLNRRLRGLRTEARSATEA